MGKGDKRTKRGKIIRGSYGNNRPHKVEQSNDADAGQKKKKSKKKGPAKKS
ncbi:MAG: 30S ribosomal protein THX [Saprospiraceae bacterium]|nr:30S ribosomal protein THX [Saprospiraceae bacterium]